VETHPLLVGNEVVVLIKSYPRSINDVARILEVRSTVPLHSVEKMNSVVVVVQSAIRPHSVEKMNKQCGNSVKAA
jgi:hypothetical protein